MSNRIKGKKTRKLSLTDLFRPYTAFLTFILSLGYSQSAIPNSRIENKSFYPHWDLNTGLRPRSEHVDALDCSAMDPLQNNFSSTIPCNDIIACSFFLSFFHLAYPNFFKYSTNIVFAFINVIQQVFGNFVSGSDLKSIQVFIRDELE